MSFEIEGWTYIPIANGEEVPALVALRNPDQLPAGIVGLYATEQVNGTWDIDAWSNASYEEIGLFLSAHLGQPLSDTVDALDEFSLDWAVLEDPAVSGIAPEPFGTGVVAGDPLEPVVVNSGDPQAILELLELVNYPAVSMVSIASTSGTSTIGQGCVSTTTGDWFGILRISFESEISLSGSFSDTYSTQTSNWSCCWPFIVRAAGDWSPWTCGAWAFAGYADPPLLGQCTGYWDRPATRTRWRSLTIGWPDCSVTACNQTKTGTATQRTTCTTPATPTLDGGYTCAGVTPCPPPAPGTLACSPTRNFSTSDWLPRIPGCP